jgi:hypothetical protein
MGHGKTGAAGGLKNKNKRILTNAIYKEADYKEQIVLRPGH